jgi:hypothetical protein
MKVVLSLCCVTLAMLLHPNVSNNQNESAFRTIKIYQRELGYNYFDSMAITTSEDFNAFLAEIPQQIGWNGRQEFIDALINAKIDFNREALVLLRHDEPSGSVIVSFETPVLKEKTLVCEIRGKFSGVGTGDMAYHGFALAVSKSLVNQVELTSVPGFAIAGRRPTTLLLSTTERQPLKVRHDVVPEKPGPGDCPKLIIGCPTDLLETGKTYVVKLVVEGGKPKYDLTYAWSVQGGEIVEGQGIPTLKFRVTHPNEIVKAFVEVGGFNPYCDRLATCSCGPTR